MEKPRAWHGSSCCVPQSSALGGLGELWGRHLEPLCHAQRISPAGSIPPPFGHLRRPPPKGRPREGPGIPPPPSVAILAQVCLPQDWRKGVGCPSLPAFARNPYRWQKKWARPLSGQARWSVVSSCRLRLKAPGARAPDRLPCWLSSGSPRPSALGRKWSSWGR